MALVNYSDSEASDTEAPPTAPTPKTAALAKSKLVNRTESKKIKVELPQIRPEPGQGDVAETAQKRARTTGAFSGFNSLLPAPKRSTQNAPKAGVSLKTSSEAAFSLTPAPILPETEENGGSEPGALGEPRTNASPVAAETAEEPKITGKPTRFMPLSVANAKKKKPKQISKPAVAEKTEPDVSAPAKEASKPERPQAEVKSQTKPKASLFSFGGDEATPSQKASSEYTPEFSDSAQPPAQENVTAQPQPDPVSSNPNTLSNIASDLDLTPAQRRQLFGRHGTNAGNVAHFNMDAEYRSNQQMAASGETFEHRQFKAIAPGKHNLQQLVNNVKSQSDALEDKWAEGRRNRGEGGSKYGF